MILTKLIDKSLVTNQDLAFNQQIGLPVEVYCSKQKATLAFGRIDQFNDQMIFISGEPFCRQKLIFFGHPNLSA